MTQYEEQSERFKFLLARRLGLKPSQITDWSATGEDPVEIHWEGFATLSLDEFNALLRKSFE